MTGAGGKPPSTTPTHTPSPRQEGGTSLASLSLSLTLILSQKLHFLMFPTFFIEIVLFWVLSKAVVVQPHAARHAHVPLPRHPNPRCTPHLQIWERGPWVARKYCCAISFLFSPPCFFLPPFAHFCNVTDCYTEIWRYV